LEAGIKGNLERNGKGGEHNDVSNGEVVSNEVVLSFEVGVKNLNAVLKFINGGVVLFTHIFVTEGGHVDYTEVGSDA
jgi:hypothetical protein